MRILLLLLLMVSVPLHAQDAPSSHERLAKALQQGELASRGNSKSDARRLAEAARMLARIGARPLQGEPDLAVQWAKQARAMGAPAPKLPVFRGRILGPAYRSVRLAPAVADVTTTTFLAGQRADISVMPFGSGDITLQVKAADDKPACVIVREDARQRCTWTPLYTARYKVTLQATNEMTAFLITN